MNEANASLNLSQKWPEFVVIEGPIGVGKTTLAKKLSRSFDSNLLLEGS
ncbi:MAG: deoxynucleoside kinase, partial [Gammaproteobacteria bacterium]|nr:deoxynucleoside kinase [Gammaproteobacteria bacterium]